MKLVDVVEQSAIAVAEQYARANGAPKASAGMLLIGMVIASQCTPKAQRLIVEGYLAQFPNAAISSLLWADMISLSAEAPDL